MTNQSGTEPVNLPIHCDECGQRVTLAYTEDTTIRTHQWVCPNCGGKNTIEVAGRDFAVHASTRATTPND